MPADIIASRASLVVRLTEVFRQAAKSQIVLANTYHLWLRPGGEILEQAGGLHRFMQWDGPILTDSGGFQVFSLQERRTLDDDGVTFRSHLDGSTHRFTPENVIAFQEMLGADVAMVLEVCVKLPAARSEIAEAQQLGISSVPTFVFDGKYAVAGAQEADVLLQTMEEVARRAAVS